MSDKVINLQDKMSNGDTMQITNYSENEPRTPETEEEIETAKKISAQAEAIISGDNPFNMTDEQLAEMGVTQEQLSEQLAYYQEQQVRQQAHQQLSYVFSLINNDKSIENIDEIMNMHLYDEIQEHMLDITIEVMDNAMKKAYEELKDKIVELLTKEKTNPFLPFEQRLEGKAKDIDYHFNDKAIEDGATMYPLNNMLRDAFENEEVKNTIIPYKVLEFAINTSIVATKDQKDQLLNLLSGYDELLQSIALMQIQKDIYDDILSNMPSIEIEILAKDILSSIFDITEK